jgi:rRNA-processing protein FCF1
MLWLLDGNNLAGGRERGSVRSAALALARHERVRILVFFDGAPPAGSAPVERLGAVEVRYVGNADAAIVAFLREKGRGWKVATDDRDLGRLVRAQGGGVVPAAAFWQKAASAAAEFVEAGAERGGGAAESLSRLRDTTERLPDRPTRIPRGVRRHKRR